MNADRTVVTGQGQDADGSGHGFAPAAPSADGVSTTMSPATDIPESASAEPGFPSGDTQKRPEEQRLNKFSKGGFSNGRCIIPKSDRRAS